MFETLGGFRSQRVVGVGSYEKQTEQGPGQRLDGRGGHRAIVWLKCISELDESQPLTSISTIISDQGVRD